MFRDFAALFGRQAGLAGVFGLAVLAERGDGHSGSHVLGCGWINAWGYVSVLREVRGGSSEGARLTKKARHQNHPRL